MPGDMPDNEAALAGGLGRWAGKGYTGADEDVHLVLKALLVNIPSNRGSILMVRLSFGMGCKVKGVEWCDQVPRGENDLPRGCLQQGSWL